MDASESICEHSNTFSLLEEMDEKERKKEQNSKGEIKRSYFNKSNSKIIYNQSSKFRYSTIPLFFY